ncbi:MAG: lipid-A-disaccharide synthase [Hydrococcus sp. RU_2_2]|nr:lipid-A-disaccharide synthase [Hydrococcus sp. RU_2_2]
MPVDLLILANGPGEITTWVLPVVKALRQTLSNDRAQVRISIILSPCPNATGKEAAIARSYPEVDRVQSSEHFFPFLVRGKTHENWDWHKKGVVIFLGGDQAFAVIIGKRLGYHTVVYAEWDVRWYRWIDRFCLRQPSLLSKVPSKFQHKLTVVGDLMIDVVKVESRAARTKFCAAESKVESRIMKADGGSNVSPLSPRLPVSPSPLSPLSPLSSEGRSPTIGFLPGSKAAKLTQGVPLCLAIAQYILAQRPQTRFILPVAPTLDLATLASYADPKINPFMSRFGGVEAQLIMPPADSNNPPLLQTSTGVAIELITQFPAYEFLSQCDLTITTVGANTAQLGSLGIPMLVLIPTQQLDAMRSWDGIPGILANLPLLGSAFAKTINWLILKQGRLFAWPNIWAQQEIVPELVGELQASDIARLVLEYLDNPDKLEKMRDRLLAVRGKTGASHSIAEIVKQQLN